MAQAYAGYPQNRGTLPPGQTILVNNYTIQVEKYLSQGGFAHVYLVRSAAPINNTTQHVLKRIAVSDEAMLREVKKEVDIMRLLRGHPNIVNFIDASWHSLPNGTYEVFILMELCAGGGIIDMMNRRLRERLTEAEILQIFVDVCEAVSAMHNLKPALLHRDLKVENILQSSLTRYKLCDFGSSTPVQPRPPSSLHEIRLLEAELNRHTTLQYRAPEMVDVHLRRPVDEKSDVWALGVLLYKLCYYTTPFEEHGPLAILNVQYKIPPYPVYSPQINSLIASMLRELGSQRPSVFEVLSLVHRMRGTKSPYRYEIPSPQSLRPALQESTSSGMESLVSFRTSSTPSSNITSAAQARQTVLEAIAPMRRGRPTTASVPTSVPTSSVDPKQTEKPPEVRKFEEKWNAVRTTGANVAADDAWNIDKVKAANTVELSSGFGDSFVDSSVVKPTPSLAPSILPVTSRQVTNQSLNVQRDAFDGLGGISRSREPSPTLAEATSNIKSSSSGTRPPRLNGISRTPIPAASSSPISPRIPASRTGLAKYHPPAPLSVEERFPSLDDLDKSWRAPPASHTHVTPSVSQPTAESKPNPMAQPRTEVYNSPPSGVTPSEPKTVTNAPLRGEARSQQVTGTAMRDNQVGAIPSDQASTSNMEPMDKRQLPIGSVPTKYRPSRPALARRHRSSMSIKPTEPQPTPQDWLTGDDSVAVKSSVESPSSPLKQRSPAMFSSALSKASADTSGLPKSSVQDSDAQMPEASTPYVQRGTPSFAAAESRSEFAAYKRSSMYAPRQQDSSSDDAEGPEDVNGRVMENDRKRRDKSRQSSVHDLVDLYGGGARSPMDRERTGLPSTAPLRQGRRTSGILIDLSSTPSAPSAPTGPSPASTASALLSPASIVPESRAELASRRSGSGSREEHTSPIPSPTQVAESIERTSRPASRASPGPPASDRGNKRRPQSMFLFPSKTSPKDPSSNVRALEAPRPRPSPRRGSISDMVDLYENLGGGARSKDPPALASKPIGLKLTKTPSPIASRFPAVSPTGASFSADQVSSLLSNAKPKPKQQRRSPTMTLFNDLNSLSHGSAAPENTRTKEDFVSRVPRRRSVSPSKRTNTTSFKAIPPVSAPSKPLKPPSLSIPKVSKPTLPNSNPRTPVTETPISSPSPERPYQGVGKLIDQWQRKTEEADPSWRSGSRPPGRPTGPRVAPGKAGKGD